MTKRYNGSIDAGIDVFWRHSLRGLYLGFTPTLRREVLANAVYFYTYWVCDETVCWRQELLLSQYHGRLSGRKVSRFQLLAADLSDRLHQDSDAISGSKAAQIPKDPWVRDPAIHEGRLPMLFQGTRSNNASFLPSQRSGLFLLWVCDAVHERSSLKMIYSDFVQE